MTLQPDGQPRQSRCHLRILDTPEEMGMVEELSRLVWPGSDLDVVPTHLLLTVVHNGGLVAGAFADDRLVGFIFGFPGLETTSHGLGLKHCSHQLGVHPDYRNSGVGFELKRFQWRFVRAQGLERITWTYDPLLSRNAHLNIAKLGAVCNIYLRNAYGELRDGLNAGLPTDRFQVDWWVNSRRVLDRMEGAPTRHPDLAGYLDTGVELLNPPEPAGVPRPPEKCLPDRWAPEGDRGPATLLVEIPADFLAMKAADPGLALTWRLATRACFEDLFSQGFAVVDFFYEVGPPARAVYALSKEQQ